MTDFKIPVDSMVAKFADHLKAYPRTILSAKFGDGKSYFLDVVKKDKTLGKDFVFLTIYPINYQVMDNKDIFDLIKYDIFCQLLQREWIVPDYEISEIDRIMWSIKVHAGDFFSVLMQYVGMIGLDAKSANIVACAAQGLRFLADLKKGYIKVKESLKTKPAEKQLEKIESNKLYECDLITRIIQCSIEAHKEKSGKKIVLIIEDMDRMDPAHMFRILNILSAHIDYGYRSLPIEPMSMGENKFGFDNIVIALDYENLKHIFKHFYGMEANFKGYISKFLSGSYFEYSLKAVKKKYILGKLNELTSLPRDIIQRLFTDKDLDDNSLREIVQSFDISLQIPNKPRGVYGKTSFDINLSLLKLMAVMKRLKICPSEIVDRILGWQRDLDEDPSYTFYSYVGPFMLERGWVEKTKRENPQIFARKSRKIVGLLYKVNTEDGTLKVEQYLLNPTNEQVTDFHDCVEHMLEFIV